MPDSLVIDVQMPSVDDAYAAARNPIRVPVSELDDEQIKAVCKRWAHAFTEHCKIARDNKAGKANA